MAEMRAGWKVEHSVGHWDVSKAASTVLSRAVWKAGKKDAQQVVMRVGAKAVTSVGNWGAKKALNWAALMAVVTDDKRVGSWAELLVDVTAAMMAAPKETQTVEN
jgi:hypothetical protein